MKKSSHREKVNCNIHTYPKKDLHSIPYKGHSQINKKKAEKTQLKISRIFQQALLQAGIKQILSQKVKKHCEKGSQLISEMQVEVAL